MLEVADVFRLHGAAYREQFGETLSSVQKQTLRDIAACRTPFFGGHVYQCDHCQQNVFAFHSCGNRSCPKCHQNQTERWLEKQRGHLLPCSYFLVTFTLPAELRPLARSHPKKIYSLLMKAAADALQKLAKDPRYLGARIGALSVLHTWTRAMLFHPHVHMLVTAGGLSSDHSSWIEPKHRQFLVPVEALSVIFRAKICAGLKKAGLLGGVPPSLWKKNWVVHCQHAGRGEKVLDYLARYVFRIAITNSRLESIDSTTVRFRYPQRFVMDRRRRRCGNCGKAGAFFAEAFPNSLWKSSRRSRRRLPCSISTAAAVSTARCRPAQGCVWRGGNRCRSPMPGIRPGCRSSLIRGPGEEFFRV